MNAHDEHLRHRPPPKRSFAAARATWMLSVIMERSMTVAEGKRLTRVQINKIRKHPNAK